jgi:ketosteroid isomerase-like protein
VEDAEPEDRIAALEARVRLLEDQLAIHRLIHSWGPAVDGDNPEAAAAIWAEDGVLLSDMRGTRLDGPAAVTVDGDTAKAVGYSRVYLHDADGGYAVWRVSANRWDFRRTADGWRVTRRINQAIDGGPKARELLNQAFE